MPNTDELDRDKVSFGTLLIVVFMIVFVTYALVDRLDKLDSRIQKLEHALPNH